MIDVGETEQQGKTTVNQQQEKCQNHCKACN
jgi:hypothetical protein